MLALPETDLERDDRPGFRPYQAEVVRVAPLTPHFTRVTFTGPLLQHFGTGRLAGFLDFAALGEYGGFERLVLRSAGARAEWSGSRSSR